AADMNDASDAASSNFMLVVCTTTTPSFCSSSLPRPFHRAGSPSSSSSLHSSTHYLLLVGVMVFDRDRKSSRGKRAARRPLEAIESFFGIEQYYPLATNHELHTSR